MKRVIVFTILATCIADALAEINNDATSCHSCALTYAPVCATLGGLHLELTNACIAKCQGIIDYELGTCDVQAASSSKPSVYGGNTLSRRPHVKLPSAIFHINTSVNADVMHARTDDGYVYVGAFKSRKGAPTVLLNGGLRVSTNSSTLSRPATASMRLGVAWEQGGHMYVQVTQPNSNLANGNFTSPAFKPTWAHNRTAHIPRKLGGILGTDHRVDVDNQATQYPYSAMMQLIFEYQGSGYICSGSLISKNVVMTAAHCVYDTDLNTWATDYALSTPDLGRLSVNVASMTTYTGYTSNQMNTFDVAFLKLDTDLSSRGWLGTEYICGQDSVSLTLSGYPGDKQDGQQSHLYTQTCSSRGNNDACSNEMLDHTCDSAGGASGSPLYDSTMYARAVHTCSYTSPSVPYNCGVWLRPDLFDVLQQQISS